MGIKLLWGGLTLIQTDTVLNIVPTAALVGAILMIIGIILFILDR